MQQLNRREATCTVPNYMRCDRAEALLTVHRMCADFDQTPPALRKPWSFATALNRHQCCGLYIHYMGLLQKRIPQGKWAEVERSLDSQFTFGFLDTDLQHSLTSEVPPGNMETVSAFRCPASMCLHEITKSQRFV